MQFKIFKALGLVLALTAVSGLQAALSLKTIPDQPRVFCGTCASNDFSEVVISAEGLKEGSEISVELKHQGGLIFSSGFPFMEGATLVKGNYPVSNGMVAFKTHFPIRGVYHLSAKADDITLEKDIRVLEQTKIQRNVISLIVVFILLGIGTGVIFGRGSGKGAALILIAILLSSSSLHAHGGEEHGAKEEGMLRTIESGAWIVGAVFSPDPPQVGQPAIVALDIKDKKTGKALKSASAHIRVDLVEYETPVFETDLRVVDGKVSFGFGYFDGSGHAVTFDISPDDSKQKSFSVIFENEVEAKAPPSSAKFGTIFSLMLIMLGGFVLGFIFSRPKAA